MTLLLLNQTLPYLAAKPWDLVLFLPIFLTLLGFTLFLVLISPYYYLIFDVLILLDPVLFLVLPILPIFPILIVPILEARAELVLGLVSTTTGTDWIRASCRGEGSGRWQDCLVAK